MKRLLSLLLSCCILITSFAQSGGTFEQQLRAILYAPGAEAVTGKYLSQKKGSGYTTYYYESRLPLEGFLLRVEDAWGRYQIRATSTGQGDQATLYNNLLAAFRKMSPDYTLVIDNESIGTHTSTGSKGPFPLLRLNSKLTRQAGAEFLPDGRVFIDFLLNLETEQGRWDHRIERKITSEAECLAAMNGLLKKTVGKTFKEQGVALGTITKLEVSATGLVYTVTKKAKAGSKAAPQSLTITYSGIDWKECDIDTEEASVLEGLTVVVVRLDEPAQVRYNENGKVTREETDKIEELTVLQEDKREMIAYINWLSQQK